MADDQQRLPAVPSRHEGDDGFGDEKAVQLTVDGQNFSVRARPGEPGVYDFDWLNGPSGCGFSSAASDRSPMGSEALRAAIRTYLDGYDHASG